MRSYFRIASVILLVTWMGFIFYMSSQPAEVSNGVSGGIIQMFAERFYPDFDYLTTLEQANVVASYQAAARNIAHIVMFAVLGLLSFLSVVTYVRFKLITRASVSVAFSALYAASDEFHQYFVSGRSCELNDFILDLVGIFGATIITIAIIFIVPFFRYKVFFTRKAKLNVVLIDEVEDDNIEEISKEEIVPKKKAHLKEDFFEDLDTSLFEEAAEELKIQEIQEIPNILQEPEAVPEIELPKISLYDEDDRNINLENVIEVSPEIDYAAAVIGKAVVKVTKVCNKVLNDGGNQHTKELVNLAIGRNELLKTNVFKILNKEITFSEKREQIEKEKNEAFDYFDSIIAQIYY